MTGPRLQSLTLENFRSIRGRLQVPLDANVVLIHGENGAGKTSVLSAIELALTGGVVALERADAGYARELTNKDAETAHVILSMSENDESFGGALSKLGQGPLKTLPARLSGFFSERCYLPQSLLGQLLQIYQESSTDADSPLSRFVTELLGLDRLDAIETGLQPVHDLRNFRKTTERYTQAEAEQSRIERELSAVLASRQTLARKTTTAMAELAQSLASLGAPADEFTIDDLSGAQQAVDTAEESAALQVVENQRRSLRSIASEGQSAFATTEQNESSLAEAHRAAEQALTAWQADAGAQIARLREQVSAFEPSAGLDILDPQGFMDAAQPFMQSLREALSARMNIATADHVRRLEIREALARNLEQLEGVDHEIALVTSSPSGLVNLLAEITAHIDGEICPVCDRDFSEVDKGGLAQHVAHKVRTLSTAAARLLDLSRSRSARLAESATLESELAELDARQLGEDDLAALDHRLAAVVGLEQQLLPLPDSAREGAGLMRREMEARRALGAYQHATRVQLSLKDNIAAFASSAGLEPLQSLETAGAAIARLENDFTARAATATQRIAIKRRAAHLIDGLSADRQALVDSQTSIAMLEAQRKKIGEALKRGAQIRRDGQAIERAVKALRSKIIRREFNERLNTLWRDLFVRLAPNEPFVPAFMVPEQPTLRLQPKLITHRRDGTPGGAPGAMLSAGNLNTAALTLFISLHLTMKARLPWLILDDPVQSMDDVHIAHFAALLRTLSTQNGRQIIVAVHDRQLFEYLKLELSPTSATEQLLAIELIKTHEKDTDRLVDRRLFREEKALRFAA